MVEYPAIITRRPNGRFFARIPDLPGVTATGKDVFEALARVVNLAQTRVRDIVDRGETVPPPRDLAEVPPRAREYGRTLLPVKVPSGPAAGTRDRLHRTIGKAPVNDNG